MSNLTEEEVLELCEKYGYEGIIQLCIVSLGGRRGFMIQEFEDDFDDGMLFEEEFNRKISKDKKYQKILGGSSYNEIINKIMDTNTGDYNFKLWNILSDYQKEVIPIITKRIIKEIEYYFPELNHYEVSQGTIFTLEKLSKKQVNEINSSENNIAKYIEYPCYENWNQNGVINPKYSYDLMLIPYKKFKLKDIQIFGNYCPDKSKHKNHVEIANRIKNAIKSESSPLKNIIKDVKVVVEKNDYDDYE